MALNVISNFAANVAHRNLVRSDMEMTDSLKKLSSGTRVVSAKDDAASMAIGSRLLAEIKALRQAQVNASQGNSMLQVADGAMARSHDILLRMKTLSVQAGSGQLSGTERGMLNTEYQALLSEIDRLAQDTEFNGNQLVNGSFSIDRSAASNFSTDDGIAEIVLRGAHTVATGTGTQFSVQFAAATDSFTVINDGSTLTYTGTISTNDTDGTTMSTGSVVTLSRSGATETVDIVLNTAFNPNVDGAQQSVTVTGSNTSSFTFKVGTGNSTTADQITVSITGISATNLGLNSSSVSSTSAADTASTLITNAIDTLNTARAELGASQNRLDFAASNIATTLENMEAARSSILDLDIASEMSRMTSKQILVQAGVAMLAQAQQAPQALMRLFQ